MSDEREKSLQYLSVLLSFFSALESRFHSVLFLTHLLRQASDLIAGKKRELKWTSSEDQRRNSSPMSNEHSSPSMRSPDSDEAEVLDVVAKLLDISLAADGRPSQPGDSRLTQDMRVQ